MLLSESGPTVRATGLRSAGIGWIPTPSNGRRLSETHELLSLGVNRDFSLGGDTNEHLDTLEKGEIEMLWEYLAITETMNTDELTALGAKGWELVAVVSPGHFILHYFFKREAKP